MSKENWHVRAIIKYPGIGNDDLEMFMTVEEAKIDWPILGMAISMAFRTDETFGQLRLDLGGIIYNFERVEGELTR